MPTQSGANKFLINVMNDAMIISCPYGASEYLDDVLPCARLNNTDTQVVLLGDESNESLCDRQWLSILSTNLETQGVPFACRFPDYFAVDPIGVSRIRIVLS